MSFSTILAIGLGGFLGSISRAYIVYISNKTFISDFPYGILAVNLLGSFLIGVAFAAFTLQNFSPETKAFLTTGFLGALTTYSTFAIESFFLLQTSFILGMLNICLNLFGSIFAAACAFKLFSILLK
ncbi:MAG: fluoride efflux transporter CrcB [Campylobacterales bacterium]|nr:fluoride efflux transporter CrcB [Campylobacterales bacterium]